jgi:hypothetical protein
MERDFQVIMPASGFSNPEMHRLSETEKSLAAILGSESAFRERKQEFLGREKRTQDRGYELGDQVQVILTKLGTDHKLVSITWNADSLSWTLEVATPRGSRNVVLPWTLVDDVLDARTRTEIERLRNMIFFGLGHRDLIFESPR